MKRSSLVATSLILCLTSLLGLRNDKPKKNPLPLQADEVAVYKAVLKFYRGKEGIALNVANSTYPLDSTSPRSGLTSNDCLRGIILENLANASSSYHELPPEILPDTDARLVEPTKYAKIVHANDPHNTMRKGTPVEKAVTDAFATGLFSMSEIAFDKEHRHAAVSYSFWCGSLCGNGSTLIFEKTNGEWQPTISHCGAWIS